jgi:cephalosporin hydroxylase
MTAQRLTGETGPRDRLMKLVRQLAGPTWYAKVVRRSALTGLIWKTGNFSGTTWLGHPIWQNPLDAWGLQEAIVGDEVDLVIECGTNRGGSAFYMASIMDLLGRGHVITIDIERLTELEHPRIDFVIGSSTDDATFQEVKRRISDLRPKRTMVLLDSDHAGGHVLRELELYAPLVPVGGYIYVQDGCIDELEFMRHDRPGPLWATRRFVASDSRFEIDEARSTRYLYSHSPSGWIRRVA